MKSFMNVIIVIINELSYLLSVHSVLPTSVTSNIRWCCLAIAESRNTVRGLFPLELSFLCQIDFSRLSRYALSRALHNARFEMTGVMNL